MYCSCRYNDIVAAAGLAESSPVRGCMIIKPWGMSLWENVRSDLDRRIRATGTENAYFPMFIPMSYFSKEAEHVEGFAKECAVVTHYRLKDTGNGVLGLDKEAELEEPLVVRPTSEIVICLSR
jgi:prolyl-tRNA synthetase